MRAEAPEEHGASAFAGYPPLLHEPDAETAVCFLLGLLWDHLNVRFSFADFEVGPQSGQTKWLDARGYYWHGGRWEPATFEFKLFSSGLVQDAQKYEDLHVTWLVCWEDDAPAEARRYADNVLALRTVWEGLPEALRHRFIGTITALSTSRRAVDLQTALAELPPQQRSLVDGLLAAWPRYELGKAEIMLKGRKAGREGVTLVRVCPTYIVPHLIVKPDACLPEAFLARLLELPGSRRLPAEGVSVPLASLTAELIDEMVAWLRQVWGEPC